MTELEIIAVIEGIGQEDVERWARQLGLPVGDWGDEWFIQLGMELAHDPDDSPAFNWQSGSPGLRGGRRNICLASLRTCHRKRRRNGATLPTTPRNFAHGSTPKTI